MPNYARLERDMLTPDQQRLIGDSRGQGLRGMDDAALASLMTEIEAAMADASDAVARPETGDGTENGNGTEGPEGTDPENEAAANGGETGVSPRGLLSLALKRVQREHDRRAKAGPAGGMPDDQPEPGQSDGDEADKDAPPEDQASDAADTGTGADTDDADQPAAGPAALAATKPKAVRRAPAQPARKPAGRKKAEPRKPDLRTGSRRVAKAKPVADGAPKAEPAVAAASVPAAPAPAPAPAPAVPADDKPSGKAGKKAAKEAEKSARKAGKKAEKAAKKAAKDLQKAEKAARKDADKAARKAERKAAKNAAPAGGKSRKGSGKAT